MDQITNRGYIRNRKIFGLIVIVALLFLLTSCSGEKFELPLATKHFSWWEYVIVYPVGWLMGTISGIFNNNYGIGIIFTTLIIRTIAWPIYSKTNDMSLKMSIMQPEMQRIQEKYANRQDKESQQRMQMEMTQLYKKYNLNPLGCLLPLLQMPIFISVYQVVRRIGIDGGLWTHKVTNMIFLGVDLTKNGLAGDWKGWILALIVLGTNIAMTYIATKKPRYQKETHKHSSSPDAQTTQKSMKIMQYVMVAMMFGFALSSNSIALYWIIGNAFSLGQTLINRKVSEKKYYKMKYDDLVVKNRDK